MNLEESGPLSKTCMLAFTAKSKKDFLKEYRRVNEISARNIFLQILAELVKAVENGDRVYFEKLNNYIAYISELRDEKTLQNYYNDEGNPLKRTNFVILACKHYQFSILEYLFSNNSNAISKLTFNKILPNNVDETGHNAFYYAIRSNNTKILNLVINQWPDQYLISNSEKLNELLSDAYQELNLKNVLLLNGIRIFVEKILLDLNFFSDNNSQQVAQIPFITNVGERAKLTIESITLLENEYSNVGTTVDSKFLFVAKFIAKNIHVLKRQLKSTYYQLPWEEIEFCLISFIFANIQPLNELSLYYHAVLDRPKILKYLKHFAVMLEEQLSSLKTTNRVELTKLPKVRRQKIIEMIIQASPKLSSLYNDYQKIRDVYSLKKMRDYAKLAISVDPVEWKGHLVIARALQVIGENMKNTLESPKLSSTTAELLLNSLRSDTKEIVTSLRDSLSHAHSLSKIIEIENNTDKNFYLGIQNDMEKINNGITLILYNNKIDRIKDLLHKIIDTENISDIKSTMELIGRSKVDEDSLGDLKLTELMKLEMLIKEFNEKVAKATEITDSEKELFNNIDRIISNEKTKFEKIKSFHNSGFANLNTLSWHIVNESSFQSVDIKKCASIFLKHISTNIESSNLKEIGSISKQIFDSVKTRINEKFISGINWTQREIFCAVNFDMKAIKSIQEQSYLVHEDINEATLTQVVYSKELNLKLSQLKQILGKNQSNGDHKEFSSYADNKMQQVALEMLLLDILSTELLENRLENNYLFLDAASATLTGKALRNYLAHDNAIIDILLPDPSRAVYLNAEALGGTDVMKSERKFGKPFQGTIMDMRDAYYRMLKIQTSQEKMFAVLEQGKVDSIKNYIKTGADVNARNNNLWTALHFAAKCDNVEIAKSILGQKLNVNVRDVDGFCPLHVSAAYGNDSVLEFFIRSNSDVNVSSNDGQTPMHIAAQSGHRDTVNILLKHHANTRVEDKALFLPLHYAVQKNNLAIVEILLSKETNVDSNEMPCGRTPLHLASALGHFKLVDFLLRKGANCNADDDMQETPLHFAATEGHIEVVKILIANGANVNSMSMDDSTPLHCAACNGYETIVNVLLENKANVNSADCDLFKPLHYAAQNGHDEIARILIKNKAEVNSVTRKSANALHMAVKNGHLKVTLTLLEHGAKIDAKTEINVTPLFVAAENGHIEIVEKLVKKKAEINVRCVNHMTPLLAAVSNGQKKIVDILIKNGARVDCRDNFENTPLHAAAFKGNKKIIEILIENGADVNSRNIETLTPLHMAAAVGHVDAILVLIEKHATVNSENEKGITPLHLATFGGHTEATIKLIEKGARVNAKDKLHLSTPLFGAVTNSHHRIVKILLENKADVNAGSSSGETPLHVAVIRKNFEIIKMLIENGAEPNTVSGSGRTPLCVAVKTSRKDVVKFLIRKGADINANDGDSLKEAIFAGYEDITNILLENNASVEIRSGKYKITLLHLAADRNHTNIVNILIERGLDVNALSIDGITPLHLVAQRGNIEMLKILLKNGADVNGMSNKGTPLHLAVQTSGSNEVVRALLDNGAVMNIRNIDKYMPLEIAVLNNNLENVKTLLSHNNRQNINDKRYDNWTLLHIATNKGFPEIVAYLLDSGSDAHALNNSGDKPVHLAIKHGHNNIIELFLQKGFNVNDTDQLNRTLLHFATASRQLAVVSYLISKGAQVNAKDYLSCTPLHLAAEFGYVDIAEYLLRNGAIYNAVDLVGRTAALVTKNKQIVDLLSWTERLFKAVRSNSLSGTENCITHRASVNAKNTKDEIPLLYATFKGYETIVRLLLESKANPNIICNGFSALHYAAKYSHPKVVQLLLSHGAVYDMISKSGKTPLDVSTNGEIICLLKLVEESFKKVTTGDCSVIDDIEKVTDLEIVRAVMNSRNSLKRTLVVSAMRNGFPFVERLQEVKQQNVSVNLAVARELRRLGDYENALKLIEQILENRIKILGSNDPGTLDIQLEIVNILEQKKDYQKALVIVQEIYDKLKEQLGIHKDTLHTRSILARMLSRQGKNIEALEIFEDVHKMQKEFLGPNNPHTVLTKANMCITLESLKRYEEALKNYLEILEIYKERYGPNDHDTLSMLTKVAGILEEQGKYDESIQAYQELYKIQEKALGLSHIDTLRTYRCIAAIESREGKNYEALKKFRSILEVQQKKLGPDHMEVFLTRIGIADVHYKQNKNIGALKILYDVSKKISKLLGKDHQILCEIQRRIDAIDSRLKLIYSDIFVDNVLNDYPKTIKSAAIKGDERIIRYLLNFGTDVNEKDSDGRTALHYAVSNSHVNVVGILLRNGADATQTTNKGNTSLHTAVLIKNQEIVEILLSHMKNDKLNAFVNAKTTVAGTAALHIAVKNGSFEIVKCLLQKGAIYNIRDKVGKTPLNFSSKSQDISCLLGFVEKLFRDAENGKVESFNSLKSIKANDAVKFLAVMNARDCQEQTVLNIVIASKNETIINKIREVWNH